MSTSRRSRPGTRGVESRTAAAVPMTAAIAVAAVATCTERRSGAHSTSRGLGERLAGQEEAEALHERAPVVRVDELGEIGAQLRVSAAVADDERLLEGVVLGVVDGQVAPTLRPDGERERHDGHLDVAALRELE